MCLRIRLNVRVNGCSTAGKSLDVPLRTDFTGPGLLLSKIAVLSPDMGHCNTMMLPQRKLLQNKKKVLKSFQVEAENEAWASKMNTPSALPVCKHEALFSHNER